MYGLILITFFLHFRGLVLCIFSGALYGQMFTGATYVQDHPDLYPGATLNGNRTIFCQDKIKSKEHKIYLDKCSHCFHKKCLNTHLKIIKINFKCPICKISYKKSFCDIIKKNIKM